MSRTGQQLSLPAMNVLEFVAGTTDMCRSAVTASRGDASEGMLRKEWPNMHWQGQCLRLLARGGKGGVAIVPTTE